ncbi:MAG: T9SS type A sorting domain-containing protein [Bacteroidota bacterium]
MNKYSIVLKLFAYLLFFSFTENIYAQPIFKSGQDPIPDGKKWVKSEDLSDEFDGSSLDESKWENTNPNRWIGRAPGIFKKDVVSLGAGKLMLTNYLLAEPEVVNGQTFTHAGGNLYSRKSGEVGYYYECRMKANKTFMSSTFWLINTRGEGSGCDQRTTELDIQECVGQITTTAQWAQNFDNAMNSNTHSRNTTCNETPTGSQGGKTSTNQKVWEEYHVYGAWWKSPSEIEFYLDGEKVHTARPAADFDLPMYLRLVTETYNWNPVPEDGGMNGSAEDRTTYYDWVRVWKLEDDASTNSTGYMNSKNSIYIYPNPSSDGFFTVETKNYLVASAQVRVFNMSGQLLYEDEFSEKQKTIPLRHFSKGMYVVELRSELGVQRRKLLVE